MSLAGLQYNGFLWLLHTHKPHHELTNFRENILKAEPINGSTAYGTARLSHTSRERRDGNETGACDVVLSYSSISIAAGSRTKGLSREANTIGAYQPVHAPA